MPVWHQRLNVVASWASIDDFLSYGLGFAVLDGDKITSSCTSVLASRQKMEIDVHTTEAYRGQGLATICALAFIDTCLQRGTQPNRECFWDNEVSFHLALKLGFTPLPNYPVYYWELDRCSGNAPAAVPPQFHSARLSIRDWPRWYRYSTCAPASSSANKMLYPLILQTALPRYLCNGEGLRLIALFIF